MCDLQDLVIGKVLLCDLAVKQFTLFLVEATNRACDPVNHPQIRLSGLRTDADQIGEPAYSVFDSILDRLDDIASCAEAERTPGLGNSVETARDPIALLCIAKEP